MPPREFCCSIMFRVHFTTMTSFFAAIRLCHSLTLAVINSFIFDDASFTHLVLLPLAAMTY